MEIKDRSGEDWFELLFTKEESDMINERAAQEGVTPEEFIKSIIEPAIQKANEAIKEVIEKRK
jgi:hypothetical protein